MSYVLLAIGISRHILHRASKRVDTAIILGTPVEITTPGQFLEESEAMMKTGERRAETRLARW
ncbi:hypothetical protein BKA93DRAFT_472011 [Sparassis latifolia]